MTEPSIKIIRSKIANNCFDMLDYKDVKLIRDRMCLWRNIQKKYSKKYC
jgi:hypothetical protein